METIGNSDSPFVDTPCSSCGLTVCLPDHPHPPGLVYHTGERRFLAWSEIESMNGPGQRGNGLTIRRLDRKELAEHEAGIRARQDARRKRDRERARRYYRKKREREVLEPQKSPLGA
jgi:hypothetical protein